MGNEEESSWMQDLKDAAFIIKLTANKLYGFRNDRGVVVSNEIDNFILESEVCEDNFYKKGCDFFWGRCKTE